MKLLTVEMLAEYMSTTPQTIYSLRNQIKRGTVPSTRLPPPVPHGPLRWRFDVVEAWTRGDDLIAVPPAAAAPEPTPAQAKRGRPRKPISVNVLHAAR